MFHRNSVAGSNGTTPKHLLMETSGPNAAPRLARPFVISPDACSPTANTISVSKPGIGNPAIWPQPAHRKSMPEYQPLSPSAAVPNPLVDQDTESMDTHVVRNYNRRQSHSFNSSAYMEINTRSRAPSPASSLGHADSVAHEYRPCLSGCTGRLKAKGQKLAAQRRDRGSCGHSSDASSRGNGRCMLDSVGFKAAPTNSSTIQAWRASSSGGPSKASELGAGCQTTPGNGEFFEDEACGMDHNKHDAWAAHTSNGRHNTVA
eukprot:jgi/Ulvmu1/8387/UM042_0094.1